MFDAPTSRSKSRNRTRTRAERFGARRIDQRHWGFLAPLAVSAAVGGAKKLFGKKKKAAAPTQAAAPNLNDPTSDAALRARFGDALSGRAPGSDLAGVAKQRALAFDPNAAIGTAAQGAYDLMKPQLDRDITSYREGQTNLGRLRSGFAGQGEDSLVRESLQDLNARVATTAVTGAGMQMANNQEIARLGEQQRGEHYDLMTGAMDRNTAESNARQEAGAARSGQRAGVLGQIGGAAAAKIPWGKLGSWAWKGVSSLF